MAKMIFGRFASKKEAFANIRRIGNQYLNDTRPIPSPDAEDIADLLDHHPDAELKIGSGIRHFRGGPNVWGKWCIFIVRTDGTEEPFSATKALTGKNPTAPAQKNATLRQEIWPGLTPRQLILDFIAANPAADYTPDKPEPGLERLRDRALAERWTTYWEARQ